VLFFKKLVDLWFGVSLGDIFILAGVVR